MLITVVERGYGEKITYEQIWKKVILVFSKTKTSVEIGERQPLLL